MIPYKDDNPAGVFPVVTVAIVFPNAVLSPVSALIVIGFWAIIQPVGALITQALPGRDSVAWFAHVGGFLFGLITVKLWLPKRRVPQWS